MTFMWLEAFAKEKSRNCRNSTDPERPVERNGEARSAARVANVSILAECRDCRDSASDGITSLNIYRERGQEDGWRKPRNIATPATVQGDAHFQNRSHPPDINSLESKIDAQAGYPGSRVSIASLPELSAGDKVVAIDAASLQEIGDRIRLKLDVDKISVSIRDIAAALAGSFFILAAFWLWQRYRPPPHLEFKQP
jgi:hypothetical protein